MKEKLLQVSMRRRTSLVENAIFLLKRQPQLLDIDKEGLDGGWPDLRNIDIIPLNVKRKSRNLLQIKFQILYSCTVNNTCFPSNYKNSECTRTIEYNIDTKSAQLILNEGVAI